MNDLEDNDIDYEHLDDLPLSEHIEWKYFQIKEVSMQDKKYDYTECLTV